jgi:class 3 adenylate cyclase
MNRVFEDMSVLCRPGNDLLSRVLRHSTIGAEEFNGRVRDGIGFSLLAIATRPAQHGQHGLSRMPIERAAIMKAIKPIELLVPVSTRVTALTHPAYQRGGLPRLSREYSFWGGFPA